MLSYSELQGLLRRVAAADSLLTPHRTCLAFALAELSARASRGGLEPLWTGWVGPPWVFRPLQWLLTPTRTLSLVTNPSGVTGFGTVLRESDNGFVDFWSIPRETVESVLNAMRHGGSDPEDVLLSHSSAARLSIQTMALPESTWYVETRTGLACPDDVVNALEFEDDEAQD